MFLAHLRAETATGVVIFFERQGRFLRCEATDPASGVWELTIAEPDGAERVERFSSAEALDARLGELEHEFRVAGWFGPYGRRS